jgi:hypothetical protein
MLDESDEIGKQEDGNINGYINGSMNGYVDR